MSDALEFTRLAELLISRQDQQQQQLELLTASVSKLTNQSADTKLIIAQNQERIAQNEQGLAKHDLVIAQNRERIAQNERVIEVFGEVQQRIINQLELIYTEQQRFNRRQENFNQRQEEFNQRQEGFNQRQDDFNIIFLEELRELKGDVREIRRDIKDLRDVVLTQHEERLRRLEDFMNGFKNAA
ncbi:hypothetical protein Q5H93_10390 [Hymenobacter sp. ASUV-10]|uniref:Uncharacterized protein n=1 Tax=Hymenobacter aranciens TaxID=3063996 RepID=A0ABT9BBI6_9BACT|nr:hypothetical protein [Hymenobacter sp. ASUV-10]MDO7875140.1 hypothetical protein [Hymenobacter sp. ASUV-10]